MRTFLEDNSTISRHLDNMTWTLHCVTYDVGLMFTDAGAHARTSFNIRITVYTIRYDAIEEFNVDSKAECDQL